MNFYQGYHTHPSQDSSTKVDKNGVIWQKHNVIKRQGYILTFLIKQKKATAQEILARLQHNFPEGGYLINHVSHALMRLRREGIVKLNGVTYSVANDALNKFKNSSKKLRLP